MRDCLRLAPSVSWKCESWLSAPPGKISGIESLRLDARRSGSIRAGLAVSFGMASFPNEDYRVDGCGPCGCASANRQVRARTYDGCVASWTSGVDSGGA